jgi:hypothetical protein
VHVEEENDTPFCVLAFHKTMPVGFSPVTVALHMNEVLDGDAE